MQRQTNVEHRARIEGGERARALRSPSEPAPPARVATELRVGRCAGHALTDRLLAAISSLRLTFACLLLACLLVFVGTLAQVEEGLYQAQARYFRSLLVFWSPAAGWKIPVFPGGYLLGGVLLINLITAHVRRFRFTWHKTGIHVIHAGLVLLLLGQLATDFWSRETVLWLRPGETKNYSEDPQASELVVVDRTELDYDTVYAIPETRLAPGREIRDARLPLILRVKEYWPNAFLTNGPMAGARLSGATAGLLKDAQVLPLPRTYRLDERNVPGAVVELRAGDAPLGSWLVSSQARADQTVAVSNRTYHVGMRFTRAYTPYAITLLEFTHEKYKGTDIPKHFASRVRLDNPGANEKRETTIFMNNPLRYDGATYYQASFAPGDTATMLQVVRNPGWLTPYVSCGLVGLGLVLQFTMHLTRFVRRRTP